MPSSVRKHVSDFDVQAISLKAQKKIASKLSTRKNVKRVLDDRQSSLLDKVYKLCYVLSGSKKESERVLKNLIKVVVKVSLLAMNDQFSAEEIQLGLQVSNKFRNLMMTVTSFYRVDYSYDRAFMVKHLTELEKSLHQLIERHLTEKSHSRVQMVFAFFSQSAVLDGIFLPESPHRELIATICTELDALLEENAF